MAKILRFRKERELAERQKRLFEKGETSPPADLILRSSSTSDARPVGPGGSDASPLHPADRLVDGSPETLRRLLRRRRIVLIALATIFAGTGAAAIFGERGYLDVRARQRGLGELRSAVALQEERVIALKRDVDRLKNDPTALERIAREKLGYARPGEITLVFPPDPGPTTLEGVRGSAIVRGDSPRH